MKYLITNHMNSKEKQEIKDKGLYCYDLRHSDDGTKIATIEKSVLVNRVGSIVTDQEIPLDDKYPDNYMDYDTFVMKNESVSKLEDLLQTKQYSNEEIINMVKEILQNPEYKDFELKYVIKNRDEQENSYAVATNGDTMIGFNPFEKEIENIPDWGYNIDDDLFDELEWNKEIIYMSMGCHLEIWRDIEQFYPHEYEHKEGVLEYIEYCKKNNITIKEIQKEAKSIDIEDIIALVEEESKPVKAKFNTKIASEMKYNGQIVDVLDFLKGKDVYNDRYTVRFNDGTINDNIMPIELEFDFEANKVNKKNLKKEREAR